MLQSLINISIITLLVSINISGVCQKAQQSESVHAEVRLGGVDQLLVVQFRRRAFTMEQFFMRLIREQFAAFEIPP